MKKKRLVSRRSCLARKKVSYCCKGITMFRIEQKNQVILLFRHPILDNNGRVEAVFNAQMCFGDIGKVMTDKLISVF